MSDLLNESLEESFNAENYVRTLCEKTNIILNLYANVQFPIGWKKIVAELINTIKNYPVSITKINDSFTLLEVKFEIAKPTKELFVWRAIDKARSDSACTCALCGEEMRSRQKSNPFELLCVECKKTAGKIGKTQTWLDKY